MKGRSFHIALASTLLFLLLLSSRPASTLALTDQKLIEKEKVQLPETARFFPKETSLSLHLMVNPKKIPEYFESTTSTKNKKEARERTENLIEGLFALTGLDYDKELSRWISSGVSLAIYQSNEKNKPYNWLIALPNLNQDESSIFLERFWQSRALSGVDIDVSRYRDVGLISSKNLSNAPIISTALVNNELLLIASNKEVLKHSLDISQLSDQNQAGDDGLKSSIQNLDNGLALLTISPLTLNSLFTFPAKFTQLENFNGLIGSLRTNSESLILDGFLKFERPIIDIKSQEDGISSLIKDSGGPIESLGVLHSTNTLLEKNSNEPLSIWLGPLIENQLNKTQGLAAKTILSSIEGPLICIKEPGGWILGSKKGEPDDSIVDTALKDQIKSKLNYNEQTYEVWSKLITKRINNDLKIDTELGIILAKESENQWWGETFEALQQRKENNIEILQNQLKELTQNNNTLPPFQLALNQRKAQQEISSWYPWQLLQSVAGKPITPSIKGLALTINTDKSIDRNSINLKASVKFK